MSVKTTVKVVPVTTSVRVYLPKLPLGKYLTEQVLSSVSGAPSVYAVHTDGVKCDTSKGCNCGS